MEADYRDGLNRLIEENLPNKYNRARALVSSTAQMVKHFFDKGIYSYSDRESCNVDTLPKCWPFVRYLIYDNIKPKLKQGDSQFVSARWNDKFIQDLVDEAKELSDLLPSDLTHQEWLFMVGVSNYMLMKDPRLVESGYISEKGREGLIMRALSFGSVAEDMYENLFKNWKEQFAQRAI